MDMNTRPTVSQWHQLKPYLQETQYKLSSIPYIICPICYNEITILGIPPKNCDPEHHVSNCQILACGHMMCYDCWNTIWDGRSEREYTLHDGDIHAPKVGLPCPMCKLDQRFTMCHHHAKPAWLPSHCPARRHAKGEKCTCVREFVGRVPATLPEGGCLPPNCHDCRRDNIGRMGEGKLKEFLLRELEDDSPNWGESVLDTCDGDELHESEATSDADEDEEVDEDDQDFSTEQDSCEESIDEEPSSEESSSEESSDEGDPLQNGENHYGGGEGEYKGSRSAASDWRGGFYNNGKDDVKGGEVCDWEMDCGENNDGNTNGYQYDSEMDIDSD